jgi:hypothetical protein
MNLQHSSCRCPSWLRYDAVHYMEGVNHGLDLIRNQQLNGKMLNSKSSEKIIPTFSLLIYGKNPTPILLRK